MGSSTILRESLAAQDYWPRTGAAGGRVELPQLQRTGARRPGLQTLEHAASHGYAACLRGATAKHAGPVVATDYIKQYVDQIRAFIPKGRAWSPS